MTAPRIAVLSFPGNNCEVESIRSIRRTGMVAEFFRWNDDPKRLESMDGFVIPGGFSYEDRGRAGMIAARDPVLGVLREQAEEGKPIIGICNGAQVLVESGLIPNGNGLTMCLARNAVSNVATGFLSEWVWITPTCKPGRCAVSDWKGPMHLPIAHGEGRYTTKDPDLLEGLRRNDQIAFCYCDAEGRVSDDATITPNGAVAAIAGLCNPAGNVVALMPHPERSPEGSPYFESFKRWILSGRKQQSRAGLSQSRRNPLPVHEASGAVEIFIGTIIVNNEERSVEQAARRIVPALTLQQLKYIALPVDDPARVLQHVASFNPNKEVAYIRRGKTVRKWNADAKQEESLQQSPFGNSILLLRRDDPDTGAAAMGKGSATGVCYVCSDVRENEMEMSELQEVFANPHASTLTLLRS